MKKSGFLLLFGLTLSLLFHVAEAHAKLKLTPVEEGEMMEEVEITTPSDSIPDASEILIPENLDEFFSYAQNDTILRLAVVLSDIYGKKDMEFTRGMLLGMKNSSLPPNSVSLKLINGEIPEDSLYYELETFEPHAVFSTHEKDSPLNLMSYAREHGSKVFNVFDTKGDQYLYNENVFQVLVPSPVFNSNSASYFTQNFPDNVLVVIGELDPSDLLTRDLIIEWPDEDLLMMTIDDLAEFSFDEGTNYLIYPVSASTDDVKTVINETVRLIAESPGANVRVIGRPSWISLNDLNSMISNLEVFIPAKCFFEPSSPAGKAFITDYHSQYGHSPIRSYPVYAVMGYDMAAYVLPLLVTDIRGMNPEWSPENMLQSYFDFRKSGWSGFFNQGAYILHYEPWGTMQKELLN